MSIEREQAGRRLIDVRVSDLRLAARIGADVHEMDRRQTLHIAATLSLVSVPADRLAARIRSPCGSVGPGQAHASAAKGRLLPRIFMRPRRGLVASTPDQSAGSRRMAMHRSMLRYAPSWSALTAALRWGSAPELWRTATPRPNGGSAFRGRDSSAEKP